MSLTDGTKTGDHDACLCCLQFMCRLASFALTQENAGETANFVKNNKADFGVQVCDQVMSFGLYLVKGM